MRAKPEFEKWLDNFWYYYKWHLIGGVLAITFLWMLISTLLCYPNNDLTISVICDKKADSFIEGLKNDFAGDLADANNDGKKTVEAIYISTYNPIENRLVDLGTTQSVYLELVQNEDTTLVFMNSEFFEDYAKINAFYDLTVVANELQVAEADRYYLDGKVFGINVSNNKYLSSKGMPNSKLYMTVIAKKESYNERKLIEHDNALAMFRSIYKFA